LNANSTRSTHEPGVIATFVRSVVAVGCVVFVAEPRFWGGSHVAEDDFPLPPQAARKTTAPQIEAVATCTFMPLSVQRRRNRSVSIHRHTFATDRSHMRYILAVTLSLVATKATTKTATPWGSAHKVEELTLPQRVGEKRFASIVELLETERGERLVRFAYSTGGSIRRGPVTLRARDLERLRAALADRPGLSAAIFGGDA